MDKRLKPFIRELESKLNIKTEVVENEFFITVYHNNINYINNDSIYNKVLEIAGKHLDEKDIDKLAFVYDYIGYLVESEPVKVYNAGTQTEEIYFSNGDILYIRQDCQKCVEKEMKRIYSKYPLVGDYEANSDIFKPEIQELIKFSIEDED